MFEEPFWPKTLIDWLFAGFMMIALIVLPCLIIGVITH